MQKQIPGPKTPRLFQMAQWIGNPLNVMENGLQQYGEIFHWARSPKSRTIFISNTEAIKQLFTNESSDFTALGNRLTTPLLGENSLLVLSGTAHQQQRRLIMPHFHGEGMYSYGKAIIEITQKVMNKLPVGKPFVARDVMQEISMATILQLVFGVSEGERYEQLKKQLSFILNRFESPLIAAFLFLPFLQKTLGSWGSWAQFIHQRQAIDKLIYTEIADRRQQKDSNRTDVLSLLMSARDKAGEGMTDIELRDELVTLLIAGYDTTALAISWILYWTHYSPNVKDKLCFELESGKNLEPVDLVKSPYLKAVCDEGLRIYPVAYVTLPRQVRKPVEILGYKLPVGASLVGATYLIHNRQDIYPNPKQFKPERFLERQFDPWEFFPFGGGTRRCVGSALALYEIKLVLATILMNFELELANKKPVQPRRRALNLAPGELEMRRLR